MRFTLFLILFVSTLSYGQISFNTGDSGLDAELNIANTEANKDIGLFKTNLSMDFGIATPLIDKLLAIMKPAEALLAARIALISKKPVDEVITSYKANKDKGWGAIAKELGIKPGSAEFHALKGKKVKGNNGNGNGNGNSHGKGKKKG